MREVATKGNLAVTWPGRQQVVRVKRWVYRGPGTGEKLYYLFCCLVAGVLACWVLYNTVQLWVASVEVQRLQREIALLEEENLNLEAYVEQATSPERLMAAARQQGMSIDEGRIVVLPPAEVPSQKLTAYDIYGEGWHE